MGGRGIHARVIGPGQSGDAPWPVGGCGSCMSTATGVVTKTARLTKEGSQKRHPPWGIRDWGRPRSRRGAGTGTSTWSDRGGGVPHGWSRVKYSRGAGGADQLLGATGTAGAWSLAWEPRRGARYRGGGPGAAEGSQAPRRGTGLWKEGREGGPFSTTRLEYSKSTRELVGIRGREKV